jgi:hypothetical protein
MSEPTRHAVIAELERRIEEMEQHADEAFGGFGAFDWWMCTLGGLALPLLLIALYWP